MTPTNTLASNTLIITRASRHREDMLPAPAFRLKEPAITTNPAIHLPRPVVRTIEPPGEVPASPYVINSEVW
jgi:hypothetical protein